MIARTESINAFRAGTHEGYVQLVATGKITEDQITRVWDATGDKRTRFDHALMEGKKASGLTTSFVLPDMSMMLHCGDASLGATAKQIVQCRCVTKYKIDYFKGLGDGKGLIPRSN